LSHPEAFQVFRGASYECARCGRDVSSVELEMLPSPRCLNCGFTVFSKSRREFAKQVIAV